MSELKKNDNFLLKEINDCGKFCTGCAACDNVCPVEAINMVPDALGFMEPSINNTLCIQCDMCRKTCPVLNEIQKGSEIIKCFAAQAEDEVRKESSSGGIFTLLAEEILKNGGVVFGATMGAECKVSHIKIERSEDLKLLRKSKYVQSDIGKIYKEIECFQKEKRKVLFSGTPCQAAGLRNILGENDEDVYVVDILCHGVPSNKMLQDYIRESQEKEVQSVEFRSKEKGWRKSSLNMFLNLKDGDRTEKKYEQNEYEKGFHSELILRKSCYECQFAETPHVSDITLGDFWGIRERKSELDDDGGTSAVIINTLKGYELFERVYNKTKMCYETPKEWLIDNRIHTRIKGNIGKEYFEHLYENGNFIDAVEGALNSRYHIGIVGPWMNVNCGGALTYYALYRMLCEMGYSPVMLSQPEGLEWDPTPKYCRYKKLPYPEYAILPAKKGYVGQREYNNYCDTFIVGSDQLFTGEMLSLLDGYADLEWVNNDKRKIAYAASFAKDTFSGTIEQKERLAYFLRRFDSFSVREKSGIKLAEEELGVSAEWVLDPVFMCDQESWNALIENGNDRLPQKPFIFGYILDPNKEKEKLMHIAEDVLGVESHAASDVWNEEDTLKWMWNIPTLSNLGNEELLSHIKNCEFLITDSFHGVCFAIIFNKPFAVYVNKERGASRFYSLLSLFHLEDQVVNSSSGMRTLLQTNRVIDYKNVNLCLEKEKERCKDWLKKAIVKPIKKKCVSDYDMACTYSDRLEKIQEKQRKFEYDSLNGRIDWLIGHIDNDLEETDKKQWEQLEDHRLRLDGIDDFLKKCEEECKAMQKKYNKIQENYEEERKKRDVIETSWSYRIGRAITFFPRCFVGIIKNNRKE